MYKWSGIIILGLSLLLAESAYGQAEEDFGIWGSVGYTKDISKKFDIALAQEFRMIENGLLLGRTFTQVGVDYKFKDWLRFGFNYRFTLQRRFDGTYGHRHRIMGDILLRTQEKQFTFTYRARFQSEVRTINYPVESGFYPSLNMRNTLKVNYRINRLYRPYLGLDLRLVLTDPNEPGFSGIDRTRAVVGMDFFMGQNRILGIYFLSNQYWNIDDGRRIYVIGAEFTFGSNRPFIGN